MPATLTVAFSKARDEVDYNWGENGTPPSFHEQRSLSERLYRTQGIDTQVLLGHSSKTMTDRYNDSRVKEWKKTGHLTTSFAEEIRSDNQPRT